MLTESAKCEWAGNVFRCCLVLSVFWKNRSCYIPYSVRLTKYVLFYRQVSEFVNVLEVQGSPSGRLVTHVDVCKIGSNVLIQSAGFPGPARTSKVRDNRFLSRILWIACL